MRYSEGALARLRADNPVAEVAERLGTVLRRSGRDLVGPCPLCGGGKKNGRFAVKGGAGGEAWACAVCCEGGDVVALAQKALGLDFPEACSWLGGTPDAAVDAKAAAAAAERERARAAERARREAAEDRFREAERARLFRMWETAAPGVGSPVEALFSARGHATDIVGLAGFRFLAEAPYFDGDEPDPAAPWPDAVRPRVVHRGPAMLTPIRRADGRFGGLHLTWFDLGRPPKCKAEIVDPASGELLPDKKVRGSKQGGWIDLVALRTPRALVAGEGIMTVSAVRTAYLAAGRRLDGVAFRVGIDLGGLGGKAAASVAHPTLRTPAGRARRVPGPEPDLDSPAMPVPDSVVDLRLLGDGDSDPFTTRAAMARAEARHRRPGRRVSVVWPPEGRDFDDMVRGGGSGH